jgi:D-alanine-D-alanine ligase
VIKNILLIFGGVSGEHDVSCISAQFIEKTLKESGYEVTPIYIDQKGIWHKQNLVTPKPLVVESDICSLIKSEKCQLQYADGKIDVDFIFPIIHGTTGEDGKLQGLMEFLDIPYAGADVFCSALCMDKYYSKTFFHQAEIPQVKFIKADRTDWLNNGEKVMRQILENFTLPVFIKPSNMGSSVGVSRVKESQQLKDALKLAFDYDDQILCEQGLNVREIEVSILGNYPDYTVSIPGEIIPHHEFYSYEAKYLDQNGATLKIPAEITPEQKIEIQSMAQKAFKAVKGDGFARIDFFIDKNTQIVYLNEINTLPGFTPISMFPMMFEKSGLKPVDLIKTIVNLGVEKFKRKKMFKTTHPG